MAAELEGVFAVVASAGATNAGTVDDLAGTPMSARLAACGSTSTVRTAGRVWSLPAFDRLYEGIERTDSFIVDPHKWLFAPYDCCALLYREPDRARRVFRQEASYLDTVNQEGATWSEWNPSEYAYHLTRRARGLPFWFSLATYGTAAYRDAVGVGAPLTRDTAQEIRDRDGLELLMDPELSVVLFRRAGWNDDHYEDWWRRLLDDQIAFVQPTSFRGEKVARLCFVNPRTTLEHVRAVLDTMV